MFNCCDYDTITHYQPGEFNSKHKTDLTDKVERIERILYEPQVTSSFQGGVYQTYRTLEPVVLYRVFGQYRSSTKDVPRGARLGGGFASTEFAESIIDAKLRLALDPAWANTKMYEAKLVVPVNETISVGIVASVRLKTGTILPGGADQILLPRDWPESWIVGYRRLTSRQLRTYPCFLPEKPNGCDEKETLYRMMCPACGCEKCQKLPDGGQFTITGKKGNQYTMQYHCLNPECQYYW